MIVSFAEMAIHEKTAESETMKLIRENQLEMFEAFARILSARSHLENGIWFRGGITYTSKLFRAGDVNRLTGDDLHRIEVPSLQDGKKVWTIFSRGPRNGRSWGFFYPRTAEFVPWKEHVRRSGGIPRGETT